MKAVILLAVFAIAFANEQCGENQHYESCGTACPITCDNFKNPPKVCVLMCNPGCHCDDGFVKTKDERCVRPEQCPAQAGVCGENARYDDCGTACPLTCDNYKNPPKICVAMCKSGCHCEKGFVKTRDGQCVRPDECPAKAQDRCGENERYTTCGTACPLTCKNYNNPPRFCNLMCKIGCECKKGFVRSDDGRCVRPEECPASADVELCSLPAVVGRCRGYFPRFFFNQETGKCEKFIYGGCGGNKNNFESLDDCHNTCVSS